MVVEDWNGDGWPDLATSDRNSATVSIFWNDAQGRFPAPRTNDFGSRPSALTSVDYDGDGRRDLAGLSWGFSPMKDSSPIAGLFHNSGDGIFRTDRTFDVGGVPNAIAAGDFDGNGLDDLAVGYDFEKQLSVFLGLNVRASLPGVRYDTGTYPIAVASGDLDGDGRLDLVTANSRSSDLSVLLGSGLGTFKPATSYEAPDAPAALVLGDFDGDGRLDVAVAGFGADAVGVLLGRCR